jgi:hypothetical protein
MASIPNSEKSHFQEMFEPDFDHIQNVLVQKSRLCVNKKNIFETYIYIWEQGIYWIS